jgi:hypothetical protein
MVQRCWLVFDSHSDELAFSVLVVMLRVLAVVGPLLLLGLAASILGGGGESG